MNAILEAIRNSGPWAPIVFTIFQFLQVTFIPISSTPVTVLGALLFPWWECLILTLIGQLAGSLFAFYLARRFGLRFVLKLIKREQYDKITARLHGREVSTLVFMFLFPVFPDDLLCLVAGLTPMKTKTFVVVQIISRTLTTLWTIFGTAAIVYFGSLQWAFYIWLLIGALLGALITIGCVYQEKISTALLNAWRQHKENKIYLTYRPTSDERRARRKKRRK